MPLLNGDGNKLLTTDKVAKDLLARWKNNLVLTKGVYRHLEKQFGEIGDTISIKLPNNAIVNEGRVATVTTPLNDKTVSVVIDKQKNIKFNWTMKDRKLSIQQFGERYLQPASNLLANHMDMAVADTMRDAYFQFGTPNDPLTHQDVTLGEAYALDVAIPCDSLVRLVTNTIDRANISNQITQVNNDALVKDAIRKGYAGELAGFGTYFSQNIIKHHVGTHTGAETVATELQNGNQLDVAGSAVGALLRGDRFTIADVWEINPITKQRTGRLQVFSVISDGGMAGATDTVTISPTMNNGTGTAIDGEGNSITTEMDKNVDGIALVGAEMIVVGDAGGLYQENYIQHRDAIALVNVFMDLPASGHGSRVSDAQSGLAISVAEYFNGDQHENAMRMDILFGTKMVRPDLIFRATNEKIN